MKCPNCSFDIQAVSDSCPFCNFTLPKDAPEGAPAAEQEVKEVNLPPTKTLKEPVRDAEGLTEPVESPAADDPLAQAFAENKIPSAEDAAQAEVQQLNVEAATSADASLAKHRRAMLVKNGLIVFAVIAVASTGWRMGLFDNILIIAGVKAPPAPAAPPAPSPEEIAAAQARREAAAEKKAAEETAAAEAAAEQARAEEKKPAEAETTAPAAKPAEWWFYGRVFDMYTLKPLAGVELMFMGSDAVSVKTDAKGQYRAKLPILNDVAGYDVLVAKDGYYESYLIDAKRSFRALGLKARHQLITETEKTKKPWYADQAQWQRRDLALFPIR